MLSSGDLLSSRAPSFTVHDAARIAADHFGIRGVAKSLPGHVDQNFLIDAGGERYVLKIANASVDVASLDLQQEALLFLGDQRKDFARVCLSASGDRIVQVSVRDGVQHHVWMVTYLEGRTLATVRPQSPNLLEELGSFLGELGLLLSDFAHPHALRHFPWDLRHAPELRRFLSYIDGEEQRSLVAGELDRFETTVLPRLRKLPMSVIHNDANDYNVLVSGAGYEAHLSGLVDFGDMVHTHRVCDVAIAATYVMLDKPDPVGAAVHVVRGYHRAWPLTEKELSVLYDLIIARLCSSVLVSAYRAALEPKNEYLRISEAPAWALLRNLTATSSSLALYRFREACGLPICSPARRATAWLEQYTGTFAPVVQPDVRTVRPMMMDLSVSNAQIGTSLPDMSRAARALLGRIHRSGAAVGIGCYDEPRLVYAADQFRSPNNEFDERRTIHLGIDLFQEAGSPVFAPMDGTVHSLRKSMLSLDFGGLIVLRHEVENLTFYTLYGHLSHASVDALKEDTQIHRGRQFATLGTPDENGGWIPHLHFQIFGDLVEVEGEYLGVAPASQRTLWLDICPDPNLILGIPKQYFPAPSWKADQIEALRRQHIGGNLSVSYRTPLHIVRGFRQYLYDATGRSFLDAVNNVPHVGHCHPAVVQAAQRQQRLLNTNTRYLHATLVRYARRLAATMPDPLEVCFFVNSGSEANDLALRLAHAHTGATGVVVLDGAYHSHLSSLIAISPYKFDGPGGEGSPSHVQVALSPDPYRGPYRGLDAATRYADSAREAIQRLDRPLCAFICESLLGCGGQVEFPMGYLKAVYSAVRQSGGLCIADEVQVGFGRVGTHFWGFETQEVVPDIVVLGKPMGNGHPIAGVVTTRSIANSFDNGMEFFSTFGGNPVSCAVGMAVLDVIERECLQENALRVGLHLRARLEALQDQHTIVGDVRGRGLFLGAELVMDHERRTPAPAQATYVANRLCERGILVSTDGPFRNVLKIKPPLVFNRADADLLSDTLDEVLREDFVRLAATG